jgi:uncharacterized phiE125 gp8 family phage protein
MSINGTSQHSIVTPPTVEPITTAEAKAHLRVSVSSQDTYIDTLIGTARRDIEEALGRSLILQTRKLVIPCFQRRTYLPYGPVQSVSSVKYLDQAGVEQTVATTTYDFIQSAEGASYVDLAWNAVWPTAREVANAVRFEYVCGYAGTGSPVDLRGGVPAPIKHALKMLIQAYYDDAKAEDREAVTKAVGYMLTPFKMVSF